MKPKWQTEIAKERIKILFSEAKKNFPERKDRCDRYVELARKISMKYKVDIPKELKRKICPECKSYIKPGNNCKVNFNSNQKVIEYKCLECNNIKRYPYNKNS